jgi:hypothetical protein
VIPARLDAVPEPTQTDSVAAATDSHSSSTADTSAAPQTQTQTQTVAHAVDDSKLVALYTRLKLRPEVVRGGVPGTPYVHGDTCSELTCSPDRRLLRVGVRLSACVRMCVCVCVCV